MAGVRRKHGGSSFVDLPSGPPMDVCLRAGALSLRPARVVGPKANRLSFHFPDKCVSGSHAPGPTLSCFSNLFTFGSNSDSNSDGIVLSLDFACPSPPSAPAHRCIARPKAERRHLFVSFLNIASRQGHTFCLISTRLRSRTYVCLNSADR